MTRYAAPLVTFILWVLIQSTHSAWTGPVQLFEQAGYLEAESVYRDPVSRISHLLIYNESSWQTVYLAVNESGAVLYSTILGRKSHGRLAIIHGEGKRLFVAISSWVNMDTYRTINLTESKDAGRTWTEPFEVPIAGWEKQLQEMLYVPETGRLFLFWETHECEIRVASRAAGSVTFTSQSLVAKLYYYGDTFQLARATYNLQAGRPIIHVAFMDDQFKASVYYSRSINNGVTWTARRKISDIDSSVERVVAFMSRPESGPRLYVAYSSEGWSDPAKLIYSDDFGQTFSSPVKISKNGTTHSLSGLSLCGTGETGTIAGLMVTRENYLEYSTWNTVTMKGNYKDYPLAGNNFYTAITDCVVDTARSLVNVTTFTGVHRDYRGSLYFVGESIPLSERRLTKKE